MKNFSNRALVASSLVQLAKHIVADEDEQDDPKMSEKLRSLRTQLQKLNSKRNKTLKQMGVSSPIKTTTKVEDLVDILMRMTTT
jgi:seryl-tRNA synthetase